MGAADKVYIQVKGWRRKKGKKKKAPEGFTVTQVQQSPAFFVGADSTKPEAPAGVSVL